MKTCTRFFTQDQIDEIRLRLATIAGAKDTQFDNATIPLNGYEKVAIVQNGMNKIISINDLFEQYGQEGSGGGVTIIMDDTPTQDSTNGVKSGGVWQAIQDIKNSILTDTCFLKIDDASSAIPDYLENGAGGGRSQNTYNQYCDLLWDTIKAGKLIVLDNYIGKVSFSEQNGNRTFTINFVTDQFSAVWMAYKNGDMDIWAKVPGSGRSYSNKLVRQNYLESVLSSYYNKTEVNQIDSNLRSYISLLRSTIINDIFSSDDFQSRPKYVKTNWFEDEVTEGIRPTTISDTLPKAYTRWEAIWEAARHCRVSRTVQAARVPTIGYGVSDGIQRLIIMYGIPAIYSWTNNYESPESATQIIVKFFDGNNITIYTIDKIQQSEYQNCYLRVSKSQQLVPITNVDGAYYSVSYSLTHCTCNNMTDKVRGSYDAIITVLPWDDISQIDYVFTAGSITVTMGGTDITNDVVTVEDGASIKNLYIHIPNVTGNISITATATDSERG